MKHRTAALLVSLSVMVVLTVSSCAQDGNGPANGGDNGGVEPPATARLYIAPDGSDENPGTMDQPFATVEKAHSVAEPGDLIYMRGGTYRITGQRSVGMRLTGRSGEPANPIRLWAYPGEKPVLDFTSMTNTSSMNGVLFTGDWWYFKGLAVTGLAQIPGQGANNGFHAVDCHNCIFELMDFHHNGGPGFRMSATSSNNLVLNCDCHDNFDPYSREMGGDADGFAIAFGTGTGNVLRGCRSWWNSDDGYDLWEQQTGVKLENCWAFRNGYKPGTREAAGNGNGFKLGRNSQAPRHIVQNCLSFDNRVAGFHENGSSGVEDILNNTAWNNGSVNFGFSLPFAYRLINNVSAGAPNSLGAQVEASHNSWDLGLTVTAADFVSVDERGVDGPRLPDGSLPRPDFLAPAPGSPLIGAGVDVGLPFVGSAPDIGGKQHLQ